MEPHTRSRKGKKWNPLYSELNNSCRLQSFLGQGLQETDPEVSIGVPPGGTSEGVGEVRQGKGRVEIISTQKSQPQPEPTEGLEPPLR